MSSPPLLPPPPLGPRPRSPRPRPRPPAPPLGLCTAAEPSGCHLAPFLSDPHSHRQKLLPLFCSLSGPGTVSGIQSVLSTWMSQRQREKVAGFWGQVRPQPCCGLFCPHQAPAMRCLTDVPGMEHLGYMWLAAGGSRNGGRPSDDVGTVTPHDYADPASSLRPLARATRPLWLARVPHQVQPRGLCKASLLSHTPAILMALGVGGTESS